MLRWEIAVAIACRLMEVNPFDQPNVQESKDNTGRLLAGYASNGALPDLGEAITVDAPDFGARLRTHLGSVRARDYVALVAYVAGTPKRDQLLQELQAALRDRLRVATTVGYGPRFQHSTGQLHKGGAANGVIVQLTCSDATDAPVPGEPYSFSVLKAAQALGDYQALAARGRRVMRVALGHDVDAGLRALLATVRTRKKTAARKGKKTRTRRAQATRGRRRARRAAAR